MQVQRRFHLSDGTLLRWDYDNEEDRIKVVVPPTGPHANQPYSTGEGRICEAAALEGDSVFLKLPSNLQRPIGGTCDCKHCQDTGKIPMFDTLSWPAKFNTPIIEAVLIHKPELEGAT